MHLQYNKKKEVYCCLNAEVRNENPGHRDRSRSPRRCGLLCQFIEEEDVPPPFESWLEGKGLLQVRVLSAMTWKEFEAMIEEIPWGERAERGTMHSFSMSWA